MRIRVLRLMVVPLAVVSVVGIARAQAMNGVFADSAGPQEFFDDSPLARWRLSPFGDLRLRRERTEGIPGRTVAVERTRATLRAGLAWTPHARFGAEFSARGAIGSEHDVEYPRVDNDAPDTLEVDRANLWGAPWTGATVRAGRMPMPLRLTELLWDAELRPWGAAVMQRRAIGALDVVRAGAGVWRREEPEDDGIVGVAQAGWSFREGAEVAGEVIASWLWFDDTDLLARGELGRQNRVVGAGDARAYAERFRIVDVQLEGRAVVASLPIAAGVDLARNVEASADGNAVRTRLTAGRFGERFGAELGWSWLRAEREALPGAFASDDWWARTRTRGHLPWVTLGWSHWARLRLFGTFEWRDGVPGRTERVVGEATLRWNGR